MPIDLLDVVREDAAEPNLRRYFDEDGANRYTGRRFEALCGGGDRAGAREMITADDLVAVQMLSVRVPAEAAIQLLDGDLGREIGELLAGIDPSAEMGTAAAEDLLADDASAHRAWLLLKQQPGIDYVIAGKLLARKRPALIPVYDRVIRCQFGAPTDLWWRLHGRLAADHGQLRAEVSALRLRAGIPSTVTVLRVLDVVLWMRHQGRHVNQACPGFATVPLT